jgi:hypothetical protein
VKQIVELRADAFAAKDEFAFLHDDEIDIAPALRVLADVFSRACTA